MDKVKTIYDSGDNFLGIEHLYKVENYNTLLVKVKSGAFTGSTNICISDEQLEIYYSNLINISDSVFGKCTLCDYDSDSKITIRYERYGKIDLSGQIGGSHQKNFLNFCFSADQTLVQNIIILLNDYIRL